MYVVPNNLNGMFLWHGSVFKDYRDHILSTMGLHVQFMFTSKDTFEMFDMGTDVPVHMKVLYGPKLSRAQLHCIGAEMVLSSMRVSSYSVQNDGTLVFSRTNVWRKAQFQSGHGGAHFLDSYWGTRFGLWTQLKGRFWQLVLRCTES